MTDPNNLDDRTFIAYARQWIAQQRATGSRLSEEQLATLASIIGEFEETTQGLEEERARRAHEHV